MWYIGMMSLMSCYTKPPEYFWRTASRKGDESEDDENDVLSFTFNRYMSRQCYLAITLALQFTLSPPPTFWDRFWQIWEMVSAWNEHIQKIFSAGWVICLDKSMSIWFSQWPCPGWVFCPCKPHPFGNEYHTTCCGLQGILIVYCDGAG